MFFFFLGLEMTGTAQQMKTGQSLEWGRSMEEFIVKLAWFFL